MNRGGWDLDEGRLPTIIAVGPAQLVGRLGRGRGMKMRWGKDLDRHRCPGRASQQEGGNAVGAKRVSLSCAGFRVELHLVCGADLPEIHTRRRDTQREGGGNDFYRHLQGRTLLCRCGAHGETYKQQSE